MKDTANAYSIGTALRACAERVNGGQRTVPPAPDTTARDRRAAAPVHLTQRQVEVLALLCEGLPNKLICRRLNIATGTVKVHISCILRELGVKSRLQAVVAARDLGLPGAAVAVMADRTPAVDQSVPASRLGKSAAPARITAAA